MKPEPDSTTNHSKMLRTLKWVHLGLVIGMFAFAILSYYLQDNLRMDAMSGRNMAVYIIPILGIVGYFGSQWVFRKLLSPLKVSQPLGQKLSRYQSASYLQYACLEIPALASLLAYLYDGFILYLAISGFLILYMYSRKPSLERMKQVLPLSPEEEVLLGA